MTQSQHRKRLNEARHSSVRATHGFVRQQSRREDDYCGRRKQNQDPYHYSCRGTHPLHHDDGHDRQGWSSLSADKNRWIQWLLRTATRIRSTQRPLLQRQPPSKDENFHDQNAVFQTLAGPQRMRRRSWNWHGMFVTLVFSLVVVVVHGWTPTIRISPGRRTRRIQWMYSSATPRDVLPPNDNDNEVSPSTVVESFSYDSTTNALDRYYHADMERILNTKRTMWEQQLHDTRRSQDDDDNDDDDDKYAPFAPWFARHKSSPRRAPGDGRNSHIHNEDRPPLLDDHTLNVLAWIRQLNRKQRPPIVTHDFDGAQRVHEMLLEWQQRQLPNEWHAPQQQQQQQWSSGMKSYEIVMQAYLQRGRLRWLGTDPHDDVYPTTPSLDETIQVLFDPEFLVEDDKTREETTMNLRKVICAADVLQDLYHQWQWNHPSQSRQYIRNRETTGVIVDSEPGSNATTSSSSSTSGVPEPPMPNNAVPLLWNPVSACWLAGQAVRATQRGGRERNYAEWALDFVHALRNHTLATNNNAKMPVEALLHGIHAAAWHQDISHPTTDSTPSIPTSTTTSSAEEEKEEERTVHYLQPEEEGGVFSKKETNDKYHWVHAMWNELIALLHPDDMITKNETLYSYLIRFGTRQSTS